jgi:phage terminase small subunit
MAKKLTPKQDEFCRQYLIDLNATQAAIRSGYSEKTARTTAAQNLAKRNIEDRIRELQRERAERTEITQDWVLEKLVANVERSMRAVPVFDREGAETGEYQYQGSVANKALELVGKHLGMFAERHEHSGPGGGPVEHRHEIEVSERVARYTGIFAKLANGSRTNGSSNGHGPGEPVDTSRP